MDKFKYNDLISFDCNMQGIVTQIPKIREICPTRVHSTQLSFTGCIIHGGTLSRLYTDDLTLT